MNYDEIKQTDVLEQEDALLGLAEDVETSPEPKKKKSIVTKVIAIVVAIIVLVFSGILFYQYQTNDLVQLENQVKAQIGQLENKSNEEIEAALNEIIEEGSLRISINMNPVFPTGESAGALQIENHPNNLYNMRVSIRLTETDEEIYHSGLMPVNSHIQEDVLKKDLDAGEYDAIATFTAYDVDSDAEIGTVIAEIRVSVLT